MRYERNSGFYEACILRHDFRGVWGRFVEVSTTNYPDFIITPHLYKACLWFYSKDELLTMLETSRDLTSRKSIFRYD